MKRIKNVFVGLLVVLALAFAINAATATTETNPYHYTVWAIDTLDSITTDADGDTMAATDTFNLRLNFVPESGWDYFLQLVAPTGTGTDSLKHYIEILSESSIGSPLGNFIVDSLSATAKCIWLPFGEQVFGSRYDIRIRSTGTGAGSQVIITDWTMIRAKSRTR